LGPQLSHKATEVVAEAMRVTEEVELGCTPAAVLVVEGHIRRVAAAKGFILKAEAEVVPMGASPAPGHIQPFDRVTYGQISHPCHLPIELQGRLRSHSGRIVRGILFSTGMAFLAHIAGFIHLITGSDSPSF
jgi:hypothetical protein